MKKDSEKSPKPLKSLWLGDQDLNLDSRSQSPLSCR
jgi:hypothetical protein